MGPRALVTGATGFIGSHLVEDLVEGKWEVTCWCRSHSRTERLEALPVALRRGRLDDVELLRRAAAGQDYIFHLAGRIHSAPRQRYDQVNHVFTRNLVRAAADAGPPRRFVYVSSIAAAGPSDPGRPKLESDPNRPVTEYGRSKLRGEEAVREEGGRLPFTIIRPPNVYGPRQRETELLIRLIRRRIVPALKDRPPSTSVIYVKDLTAGLIRAALSPQAVGQTYTLTDGRSYSWREVVSSLKQCVLGSSWYVPVPEDLIARAAAAIDALKRAGLIRSFFGRRAWDAMIKTPWLFSNAGARRDFGFSPRYTLVEGLTETLAASPKD